MDVERGNNYNLLVLTRLQQNLRPIVQGPVHQGANLGENPEIGVLDDRIQQASEGCGFR